MRQLTEDKGRGTSPDLYGDGFVDGLRRQSARLAEILRSSESEPDGTDARILLWSRKTSSILRGPGIEPDRYNAYREVVTGGLYEWAIRCVPRAEGTEGLLDRLGSIACLLDRVGSPIPPIEAEQIAEVVDRWNPCGSKNPLTSRALAGLGHTLGSPLGDISPPALSCNSLIPIGEIAGVDMKHVFDIVSRWAAASSQHPATTGVLVGSLRDPTDPPRGGGMGPTYAYRSGRDQRTNPRPNTIETPPGIARFLRDLIVAEYDVRRILDPCAGRGKLTEPWVGCEVTSFEINDGKDFFEHAERVDCDLVLANPPFNNRPGGGKRFLPADFLSHILAVVSAVTPIALISPMGMRLNQRRRSRRWRWMRDQVPAITGIVSLPIDTFEGVEFHTEVLFFNMGRLEPHYFVPDGYFDDKDEDRRDRTSPGGIDGDRG